MQEPIVKNGESPYCDVIADRILLISPRPAAFRTLVAELADRCFDVMLFHHADDPAIASLQDSTLLIDRTMDRPPTSAAPIGAGQPLLQLVSPETDVSRLRGPYLVWPCPMEEALSAIRKLSSGRRAAGRSSKHLMFKDILMDLHRMTVTRAGIRVALTRTEFELLRVLLESNGKALDRQELLDLVWGDDYFGGSNAVDVHIRSLRRKLRDDPRNPRYIATVRGIGYQLADA